MIAVCGRECLDKFLVIKDGPFYELQQLGTAEHKYILGQWYRDLLIGWGLVELGKNYFTCVVKVYFVQVEVDGHFCWWTVVVEVDQELFLVHKGSWRVVIGASGWVELSTDGY